MLFHFWFCNVTQWDIIQQNMVKDQMTLEIFLEMLSMTISILFTSAIQMINDFNFTK